MTHARHLENDATLFAAAIARWDDEGGAILSERAKNNYASEPGTRQPRTRMTAFGIDRTTASQ